MPADFLADLLYRLGVKVSTLLAVVAFLLVAAPLPPELVVTWSCKLVPAQAGPLEPSTSEPPPLRPLASAAAAAHL